MARWLGHATPFPGITSLPPSPLVTPTGWFVQSLLLLLLLRVVVVVGVVVVGVLLWSLQD